MLGCQDFCGYYDWTFHYVARRCGPEGLNRLWAEAIGGESQAHYERAARMAELRGLLDVWTRTGQDEHCDWTFTLDERRNTLRWDMRKCPSKQFLLDRRLNASEDYCDHCMGWILPLLERVGVEVVTHEHNHNGQCWAELSMKGRPRESLNLPVDIRRDPNWQRGYIDRWQEGRKQPMLQSVSQSPDPCDVMTAWFSQSEHMIVLGRGPSALAERHRPENPTDTVLVTGATYILRDVYDQDPKGVIIGDHPILLDEIAHRYLDTPPEKRPLLMHLYLPERELADFGTYGLPRPIPILPMLIRRGLYTHQPGKPYPTTGVFMVMLATALGKTVHVAGIDNYRHPSGKVYATESITAEQFTMPVRHTPECDLEHIRRAVYIASAPVHMTPHLRDLLAQRSGPSMSAGHSSNGQQKSSPDEIRSAQDRL